MPTNFDQFSFRLDANVKKAFPGPMIQLQRKLALMSLGAAVEVTPGNFRKIPGVVFLTAVRTGRARSNWQVSVGGAPTKRGGFPASRNANGVMSRARTVLAGLKRAFQTIWVTNSLPYIHLLEYGGYPSPVKRGTWDSKLKRWVKRSEGGFTKQRPAGGMVRLTFRAINAALGGVRREA